MVNDYYYQVSEDNGKTWRTVGIVSEQSAKRIKLKRDSQTAVSRKGFKIRFIVAD